MDIHEKLLKQEQSQFDDTRLQWVITQMRSAENQKISSGWDIQMREAYKILQNLLPLASGLQAYEGWTGEMFRKNWILTGLIQKKSMLLQEDIEIDLKDDYGAVLPEQLNLTEDEINYAFDEFDFLRKLDKIVDNMLWTGVGSGKLVWDSDDIDEQWLTGKPDIKPIDSRYIYFDSLWRPGFTEPYWIGHKTIYKTSELQEKYPDIADKISATIKPDGYEKTSDYQDETTTIFTVQYRKSFLVEKRALVDEYTKQVDFYPEEEYQQEIKKRSLEMGRSEEELSNLAGQYDENALFPEAVRVTEKKKVNEQLWFEVKIIPDLQLVLEEPQLVGKNTTYFVYSAFTQPNSPYSFGYPYYLKDLLEASIALMTYKLIFISKFNKPVILVWPGAIENEDEFLENFGKLDVRAKINEDWANDSRNVGRKPFIVIYPQDASRIFETLSQEMDKYIQDFTSSPDVARGQIPYAGMSGKQVGMLQVAAKSKSKYELIDFRYMLEQISERLRDYLFEYRIYPHNLRGVTTEGDIGLLEINKEDEYGETIKETQLTNQGSIIVIIKENEEYQQAIKEQRADKLFKLDQITKEDHLRMYPDLPNVDKLLGNKKQQDTNQQLVQQIQQDPKLQQIIMQYFQSQKMGKVPKQTEQTLETRQVAE